MRGIIIHAGDYLEALPETVAIDEEPTLKELQNIVGGNIEIVETCLSESWCGGRKAILIIDEEGKLKKKEVNMEASLLLPVTGNEDFLVGDAILLSAEGEKILALSEAEADKFMSQWFGMRMEEVR